MKTVKRIFSVMMALLCSLSIRVPVLAERVVGENGGASVFPPDSGAQSSIKVSVRENVSRYAVDLVFPDLNVTFSNATWNVNELAYELWDDDSNARVFNITVINHSNEAINTWGEVQSFGDAHFSIASTDTGSYKLKIPGVTPNSTTPQSDTVAISIVPMQGETWRDVLASLFPGMDASVYEVGTISIFVEKS